MPKPAFYLMITVVCVIVTPYLAIRRGCQKIKETMPCCKNN